ncbi:MAG: acyl carrier protein [Acholeplasmatales bacterium]|nr:acyl carrier protein [Acholeplasmatales bacterium]
MSVFDKVKEIILQELSVDAEKVTIDANLKEDLGADSIDAVQIIMDLEDTFGIEIDTDNADAIATVGNLVDYIESLTK